VLIVHGDKDRSEASAEQPLPYAERVREITPDVCRFEVAGGNHYLLSRAVDVWAVTADFVLGTLFGRPLDPAIVQAMAADDGLRHWPRLRPLTGRPGAQTATSELTQRRRTASSKGAWADWRSSSRS
jgi:hypothetical protein